MALVQTSEDADFRNCFMESIISKGAHKWLADQRWELPQWEIGKDMMKKQA